MASGGDARFGARVDRPGASSVTQQVIVGGQEFGAPNAADVQVVAGTKAKLLANGQAAAPADAPAEVQQAIWAANRIIGLPYRYGGGHQRFEDAGYDCSGTVSYALHGGELIDTPMDSSDYMTVGRRRQGRLDHRLHEPRARLHRDRRAAPRHERRRRPERRQGPALAPDAALEPRLPRPSPRRPVGPDSRASGVGSGP